MFSSDSNLCSLMSKFIVLGLDSRAFIAHCEVLIQAHFARSGSRIITFLETAMTSSWPWCRSRPCGVSSGLK